jgi:glycine cleavage system transcriptional repressor
MSYVLLSISGHDRAGIVRDVAESLLHIKANIEDSSMTALRGRFTMMMIVKLHETEGMSALKATLAELEQRTGLTVQSQPVSEEEAQAVPQEPDCVVTVSGADKPGIVHAVAEVMAGQDASIVDVSTRARDSGHGEVYMMALEAVCGAGADALRKALADVSTHLDVEIEVHELDGDIL